MKLLLVLTALFLPAAFAAEGTCVSRPDEGAHEAFCNNLNAQTCGVHSALCTWEKANIKTLKVISKAGTETIKVIESADHACTAKAGMEAHESFCANQSKVTCSVHSMCKWE